MHLGTGEIIGILLAVAACVVIFTKGKALPEIAANLKKSKDIVKDTAEEDKK